MEALKALRRTVKARIDEIECDPEAARREYDQGRLYELVQVLVMIDAALGDSA